MDEEIVMLLITAAGSVVIVTPDPAINLIVSKPLATKSVCPVTFHVLNVEFMPILTIPLDKFVKSKPLSTSNNKLFTSVIKLLVVLPVIVPTLIPVEKDLILFDEFL